MVTYKELRMRSVTLIALTVAMLLSSLITSSLFAQTLSYRAYLPTLSKKPTHAPAFLVKDINPIGSSTLTQFAALKDKLLFVVDNQALWSSDGTAAGTQLLQAVAASNLTAAGSRLYFTTQGGLWIIDGSSEHTSLLHPLESAGDNGNVLADGNFVNVHGTILFVETVWNKYLGVLYTLWASDGTPGGTVKLQNLLQTSALDGPYQGTIGPLVAIDTRVFFISLLRHAPDPDRLHLFLSDGTAAGTLDITSLTPEGDLLAHSDRMPTLAPGGAELVFASYDPTAGRELWISDGTTTGTQLLQDINPGSGSSNPADFTVAGNYRFFVADDGQHGRELWAMSY